MDINAAQNQKRFSMSNLGLDIALGLIKVLVSAYDVVTLPVYFVCQRPWDYWRKRKLAFAKCAIEGDPSAPYVRTYSNGLDCLNGIRTMDELTRKAVHTFGDRPCLGSREVLGESEERQADGKVFKKLVLGDYKWLSYKEVDHKIDLIGRGLMAHGVRPRQNVVILAETRIEWMLAAQACLRINIPGGPLLLPPSSCRPCAVARVFLIAFLPLRLQWSLSTRRLVRTASSTASMKRRPRISLRPTISCRGLRKSSTKFRR